MTYTIELKEASCGNASAATELAVDGFIILVEVVTDEDCQFDWIGEFTNNPGKKCVPNPNAKNNSDRLPYIELQMAEDDHFQGLVAQGMSKKEARKLAKSYVKQDVERLARWGEGELQAFGMVVTASKAGVELGCSALWGIDTDGDPTAPYMAELAQDLIKEAIEAAKEKLKELCSA